MSDQVYMEAYYGKLPEFEEIEKCFGIIQEKARKEGYIQIRINILKQNESRIYSLRFLV